MNFAAHAFAQHWATWTTDQRENVLADLVAPYELSAASSKEFVRNLEARISQQ